MWEWCKQLWHGLHGRTRDARSPEEDRVGADALQWMAEVVRTECAAGLRDAAASPAPRPAPQAPER